MAFDFTQGDKTKMSISWEGKKNRAPVAKITIIMMWWVFYNKRDYYLFSLNKFLGLNKLGNLSKKKHTMYGTRKHAPACW